MTSRGFSLRRACLLASAGAILGGARAAAQLCDTMTTRIVPHLGPNIVIRSIAVKTDAPVTLPLWGGWLGSLRRTTETRVVRRQLLFAPGERVDTALVAETLRRLRDRRLYADVVLATVQCAESDSVDFIVTTRDAWTLRPIARIVPPTTVSIGVEDRNLLGTGRLVSITNDQTARGHGGAVAVSDPLMFGTDVVGTFRFSDVAANHLLRASVRHMEVSARDPWRVETGLSRQRFTDFGAVEHPLNDLFIEGHIGRLVGGSDRSINVPYVGPELDQADVVGMLPGATVGPPTVNRREFVGFDLGFLRRAALFDTVSWFAAGRGFLDIPLGFEGDALISPGADRSQHAAAMRYDAWLGRMWIPRRGQLFVADLWTNGFVGYVRSNRVDRASFSGYAESARGFWGGRFLVERMWQLDPDERVQSLATISTDPSLPAVPAAARLANRATVMSVERSLHLVGFGRASMLDGALFAAGSLRSDIPSLSPDRFSVAVVGARLRLLSANGSIASTRVDLGFPVAASGSVVHRPLLSVSITSLFDAARQRDGRRRHQ